MFAAKMFNNQTFTGMFPLHITDQMDQISTPDFPQNQSKMPNGKLTINGVDDFTLDCFFSRIISLNDDNRIYS